MLASVLATPGAMAFGVQWLPVSMTWPLSFLSGWPFWSRILVTGVGSHRVPLRGDGGVGAGQVERAGRVGAEREGARLVAVDVLLRGRAGCAPLKCMPMASAVFTGPSTLPSASSRPTK